MDVFLGVGTHARRFITTTAYNWLHMNREDEDRISFYDKENVA